MKEIYLGFKSKKLFTNDIIYDKINVKFISFEQDRTKIYRFEAKIASIIGINETKKKSNKIT